MELRSANDPVRALSALCAPLAPIALLLALGAAAPAPAATQGELWGWALIDIQMATPPISFPPGTEIERAPPLLDPSLHVNVFAYDDPRSLAQADTEAGITGASEASNRLFASCLLESDSDGDLLIPDPVDAEAQGTWTQAYQVVGDAPGEVDLVLEWTATGSAFVDKFGDAPLGEAEIDFVIERTDGGVVAQGTSAARRLSLTGGPPFEELQDTEVTGDWVRLEGGDVDGEGQVPVSVANGGTLELTLAFGCRAFVHDESTGDTQADIDVRVEPVAPDPDVTITPVPVPEPGGSAAALAALGALLGASRARRPRLRSPVVQRPGVYQIGEV